MTATPHQVGSLRVEEIPDPVASDTDLDAGALNREVVLQNDAVVGSVNANLRHYEQAAQALARAETNWLEGLITTRVPLAEAPGLFARPHGRDVKVVITLGDDG